MTNTAAKEIQDYFWVEFEEQFYDMYPDLKDQDLFEWAKKEWELWPK